MVKIVLYSILGLVGIVVLLTSKKAAPSDVFCPESTNTLRGVAVIAIIVSHLSGSLQNTDVLLNAFGYLATGFFLFISGYGNTLSLQRRGATARWIINKLFKIYQPTILCCIWSYILLALVKDVSYNPITSFGDLLLQLLTLSLPVTVNWFTKVILVCFILHWCVKRMSVFLSPPRNFIAVYLMWHLHSSMSVGGAGIVLV